MAPMKLWRWGSRWAGDDYIERRARLSAETLDVIDALHETHVRSVCASAIDDGYEREAMLAFDE